jgi:hypothetical protein
MTTKQPIQADLLHDTGPQSERDERFAGVHLVDVDEDGEGKTTAERVPGGWQIREWELTDALDGVLGPDRYWFARWSYSLPDKILASCVNLLLLEKLGEGVPPLPVPEVVPAEAELAPGEFVLGTLERRPAERTLETFDLLYCQNCKGEDGLALQYRGGSTVRDLPTGEPGCTVCGGHLEDLPF